jgi:CMP-N-acetylneuraminic acid synthetase
MLFWAWKACQESLYDIDVYVSTDSDEIEKVCVEYGINVIRRPECLGDNDVFKQEVIRWTARTLSVNQYYDRNVDYWISLQPNSPEIKSSMIDGAISKIVQLEKDELIGLNEQLEQNACFRIFKSDYVYQEDLSTNMVGYICPVTDVHTKDDVDFLEQLYDYKRED